MYYINKDLNSQKFDKAPGEVTTVSLYPNSENPHMRTGWEYQIAYENSWTIDNTMIWIHFLHLITENIKDNIYNPKFYINI